MTDEVIKKRVGQYMREVRAALKEQGKRRSVDIISLDILETNLRLWLKAASTVEELGILFDSDRGNKSKNPAIDVANASLRQVLAILQDYGLTAISRKRLERGEQKPDEDEGPLMDFFKGQ